MTALLQSNLAKQSTPTGAFRPTLGVDLNTGMAQTRFERSPARWRPLHEYCLFLPRIRILNPLGWA